MPTIFFVSSIGDTDLAKATITKLVEEKSVNSIFIVPVTDVAKERTKDLSGAHLVTNLSLTEITQNPKILSEKQISAEDLAKVSQFIEQNKIQCAYIGVPSPIDEEIPFQIARSLKIPCTIAYEYMFTPPETHSLWKHVDALVEQATCQFAVPLPGAQESIMMKNKNAQIKIVGHLSIDRALIEDKKDVSSVRKALLVAENDELAFISGTTQPTDVDNRFLTMLLDELATGKYPHLQLRLGLHPGVKDPDAYLKTILTTCANYSGLHKQFKIILTPQFSSKLKDSIPSDNEFILQATISGNDAAQCAEKVAQAVPGALLNEAAIRGKPAYFPEEKTGPVPYLPGKWFANSLSTFFTAKAQTPHSQHELKLKDTTATNMARVITESEFLLIPQASNEQITHYDDKQKQKQTATKSESSDAKENKQAPHNATSKTTQTSAALFAFNSEQQLVQQSDLSAPLLLAKDPQKKESSSYCCVVS